eukprot:7677032-Karenia_brevis.AAC.1
MGDLRVKRTLDGQQIRDARGIWSTVLNVSPDAGEESIKRAYRDLSLLHHPDKGGDKELFQAVRQAYEQAFQSCIPASSELKGKKNIFMYWHALQQAPAIVLLAIRSWTIMNPQWQ